MQKLLAILVLSLLFLWGGLYLAATGANTLLVKNAIPQALTVAREADATYKLKVWGRELVLGRAIVLGDLTGSGFLAGDREKIQLPLGRLDQLIAERNRILAKLLKQEKQ